MPTKTCRVCSEVKDLIEFYAAPSNKDGLANLCKSCHKIKNIESYAKNAERNRAYAKKYKQDHLEAKREYSKGYRRKNKEKLNQYCRDWRAAGNKTNRSLQSIERQKAKHRERYATDAEYRQKVKEQSAQYRKDFPDRSKAAFKAWSAANKEAWYKGIKQWQKLNRDKLRIYRHKRRALLRGASLTEFNMVKVFDNLLAEQKGLCAYCSVPFTDSPATLDHIVPISKGGLHEPSNFALACRPCNCSKHDNILYDEWVPPNLKR